jgi:hypothetical protein
MPSLKIEYTLSEGPDQDALRSHHSLPSPDYTREACPGPEWLFTVQHRRAQHANHT